MQGRFSDEGRQLKYMAFYRRQAEEARQKLWVAICCGFGLVGFGLGFLAGAVWYMNL